MALPLKSGADLYNQQLIRAAVWNYSADGLDPSEYATGLMYFNTNPSSNMYQKLRFRTGTDWKTIAFAEDLDVATNKDFLALKEKVDLLSGEVDTDAIINNMKEVSAFLSGFAEDASLMDYLNTELGKKLDKTEGMAVGYEIPLTVKSTRADGAYCSILFYKYDDRQIASVGFANGVSYLSNELSGGKRIGVTNDGTPVYKTGYATADTEYTLLHSGNIGEYKAGGLAKPVTIWGQSFDGTRDVSGVFYDISGIEFLNPVSNSYLIIGQGFAKSGMSTYLDGDNVYLRYGTATAIGFTLNSSGNVGIGTTNPQYKLDVNGDIHALGDIFANVYYARRNSVYDFNNYTGCFRWGEFDEAGGLKLQFGSDTAKFEILDRIWSNAIFTVNSSGNVGIGASDLAGTSARLYVNGDIRTSFGLLVGENADTGVWKGSLYSGSLAANDIVIHGDKIVLNGGNVGIGTLAPQAKLHVSQDIVANGTIACKGVAAAGSADSGAVDMVYGTMNGDGSKRSWTFNHGLSSANLVVNVYEYNNGSWDMILTDVDIVGNTKVTITFGSAPASGVQHKVVIIGGVGTEVIGS